MEKVVDGLMEMLASLPIGYMFNYPHTDVPQDFIEVVGQKLLKSQYMDLYQILRGNVTESGEHFILPDVKSLMSLFDDCSPTTKIIIKYR